jgi:hypothetical protein
VTINDEGGAWHGYWRPRPCVAWILVCAAESYDKCLELLQKLAEAGDHCVVPQGCVPAAWQSESGLHWD